MIGQNPGPLDPYDAVLFDLRSKRDELDTAIRTLETLRDGRLGVMPGSGTIVEQREEPEDSAGMYLGMSIVDAAKKLLKSRKRALSNTEILKDIQAGGVVLTGADPLNVVGSVLTRRFNTVGDVVRVSRGTWGLKEWYPNRNFKPNAKLVPLVDAVAKQPTEVFELKVNDLGGIGADEDDDL